MLHFEWCLSSSCQNTCFRRAAWHTSGHSTEGIALIDGTILHTSLSLVFSSDLCVWTLRLGTGITHNLFYGNSLWAHSPLFGILLDKRIRQKHTRTHKCRKSHWACVERQVRPPLLPLREDLAPRRLSCSIGQGGK